VAQLIFTLPKEELRSGAWYGLELEFDMFGHAYEWRAGFRV